MKVSRHFRRICQHAHFVLLQFTTQFHWHFDWLSFACLFPSYDLHDLFVWSHFWFLIWFLTVVIDLHMELLEMKWNKNTDSRLLSQIVYFLIVDFPLRKLQLSSIGLFIYETTKLILIKKTHQFSLLGQLFSLSSNS